MEMAGRRAFLLLFLTGGCWGRMVRIQEGPLYRVVDNPVSIRCDVSEFEGPPTQDFEWFLYRAEAPDISISIASSRDPAFPYAMFYSRVQSGDITIQRLSGDSAMLHIKRLRPQDQGIYECYTPTTDSRYLGSYSAKTTLTVMPDALQVSAQSPGKARSGSASSPPLQLQLVEGRELHLTCLASADSAQHTHLSVTFGVSDPGAPVGRGTLRDIITLQRDFSVEPSEAYARRYRDGEIRLEMGDNSTYRMVISRLRPQDAGSYHCTAAQWIQDPDQSWQRITEKRSVLAQVTLQPIESQLQVTVAPHREVHAPSGGVLDLFCNVTLAVPPPPDLLLSVEWRVSSSAQESPGQLVVSLGTDGTVSLGERYTGVDAGNRLLSLEKLPPAPGSFRLRIYSILPGDMGAYSCRARAFISYPGGRLEEAASRVSPSITVLTDVPDIAVGVYTFLDTPNLYRGDTAVLICNVTVEPPQMVYVAVSWWVELAGEKPNERTGRLLASMNRQGVSEAGTRYSGAELSTDKVGPQCYRLRLYHISPEDEGMYHCAVTAWIQSPHHTWYNAASAKSNLVKIYPYAQAKDLLLIPMIGGVASALVVGITILSTVTCCYIRQLRLRKR